jgi:hypothetical protein
VDVINAFVAGVMEVARVDVVLKLNSCPSSKTVQAFNSFLKIPASGYRFTNNGKESNFPHTVHMWTRSVGASSLKANYLYANTSGLAPTDRVHMWTV